MFPARLPMGGRGESKVPLLENAGRDLLGDGLAVTRGQGELCLRCISQESAFHEHGRLPTFTQDEIFGVPNPAILRAYATNDLSLNPRS